MASIDFAAQENDITMDQGSALTLKIQLKASNVPINMTGYDLRMQVRRSYSDTTTLINCTLANGKLSWIDAALGKFQILLAASDTSSIRFLSGEDTIDGVYDLEITDVSGNTTKPMKGSFSINREVTR